MAKYFQFQAREKEVQFRKIFSQAQAERSFGDETFYSDFLRDLRVSFSERE